MTQPAFSSREREVSIWKTHQVELGQCHSWDECDAFGVLPLVNELLIRISI
jgi:hypothetical protein